MTTATSTPTDDRRHRTVQVYRVYITALPRRRVGRAHRARSGTTATATAGSCESDLRPGSRYVTTAGSGMQEYGDRPGRSSTVR